MNPAAIDAGWLQALRARADLPPARPRQALCAAGMAQPVGSIEPALAARLAGAGLPLQPVGDAWQIAAPLDPALARIARWLDAHDLGSRWRDELLAVTTADGHTVGAIERAAVRPLGIATHAVHLIGWAEQGGMWVQQRALDKATDPGLWDTLMGGLISADETVPTALDRETWEEAGLRLDQLQAVSARGRLTVSRPVSTGYMVEQIHVYEAVVPHGVVPLNQDGEVAVFECLPLVDLSQRLQAGRFTLEAALILADALANRLRG